MVARDTQRGRERRGRAACRGAARTCQPAGSGRAEERRAGQGGRRAARPRSYKNTSLAFSGHAARPGCVFLLPPAVPSRRGRHLGRPFTPREVVGGGEGGERSTLHCCPSFTAKWRRNRCWGGVGASAAAGSVSRGSLPIAIAARVLHGGRRLPCFEEPRSSWSEAHFWLW